MTNEYIKAAARNLYMKRLYENGGTDKMDKRAKEAGAKFVVNTMSAAGALGITHKEAKELARKRYEEVFC